MNELLDHSSRDTPYLIDGVAERARPIQPGAHLANRRGVPAKIPMTRDILRLDSLFCPKYLSTSNDEDSAESKHGGQFPC
jgi:hypothetical protein